MNANIMKGERSKLLAAVAVLVMMVCVFAVAIPNSDAAEYGSIDLPEEYGTLTSASSGTVDLSADEYTDYVIEGDISYTKTVDFTLPEGETIYIKSGSLVFNDGDLGNGSMDLAGTVCILNGAKLSVGSSTMSIKDTFQVKAEAGSTFVVESGSYHVDENFIGNDENAIVKLTDREKMILGLRFFQGKTQMEVAQEIGISQAQVSRLEKGALDKVKGNS